MYLFTRNVLVNPSHLRAGMAHAVSMSAYVNEKTGLGVSLFQVLQGAPLGTLTFAYRTDSYAASLEVTDPMLRSDEYLEKVETGAQYFIGNPEDRLGDIIHVAGELSGPPAAASIVTATMNVDQAAAAVSWSVNLADYMGELSGSPVAVLTSQFGQYGTLSWLAYGQSIAQLEEAGKKMNSDPGFLKHLGESSGFFVPGSGTGILSRKIA